VAARAVREAPPGQADLCLVGPEGLDATRGLELVSIGKWQPGGNPELAGRLSTLAIQRAVRLALEARVDAVVTAPINKAAIASAGYSWPGHTEMLRDLTGVPRTALCLAAEETAHGSPLRVVLVTGHIALRQVPDAYTTDELVAVARLTRDDLRRLWGLDRPRLAVCAFNPHASDAGLFGDEEARICAPAVDRLRGEGVAVDGPIPADTVFVRAMRGEFDAVLAPYHDLGMVAIKTAAFGQAVNVTLGLPFPRTSPDHGTAFDIAGTGRADASSMTAALAAAVRFAQRSLTLNSNSDRLASG
jgi:4-hydroxythreonine-4-phosphate dehydrogenase